MTSTPDPAASEEGAVEGAAEVAAVEVVAEEEAVMVVAEEEAVVVAPVPDEALLDAHDLALAALREITPAASIGAPAGYSVEADGVVSLRFETLLAGYPGWHWTVSLARVADAEPTVLEVELLPGENALLAPEWVPWAVRLAEYRAQQAAAAALAESEDADDDDVEEDDAELDEDADDDSDDLDEADFDADGSSILHAGDVDGVDIDELDDDADDDSDDESDEDDDDEDDTDDPEDDDRR